MHTRVRIGLAWVLVACAGCGDDASGMDGGAGDQAMKVVDLQMPDLQPYPWGLDNRPANPTCKAPDRPDPPSGVALQQVFPNLAMNQPLWMGQAPGDMTRWYILEKGGLARVFDNNDQVNAASTVIDLTARVNTASEGGLLGMAFHPSFAQNHYVFLFFSDTDNTLPSGMRSTVARYVSPDGGKTLDPNSEQILFTIAKPEDNHNGGNIVFGPDGYLYIGTGDGGGGGDQHGTIGNGQDVTVLLGKMLRIDVDNGNPYAIPADNPFASGGGAKEIFAWGLRNPWRWSFDRATGVLWAGDVGQNLYEEVDQIQLGGNYGWRLMEGFHLYPSGQLGTVAGTVLPLIEYDHTNGCAITGGYVYRGAAIPSLVGNFIYADECSGKVWAGFTDPMTGAYAPQVIANANGNIASFGEGIDGELYLVDIGGNIYKMVPSANPPPTTFPQKLSQTGCVDPANPVNPASGLIPYDVASPLWSDGASKRRWMALPDGMQIHVNADGDWDLPIGSVLMKEFTVGGKRAETRLLVHHMDGGWAGYSYAWNDQETDADLLPADLTKMVGGQNWYYPARAQCLQCHTMAAGRSLGLETQQLNTIFMYPNGKRANQVATLDHIGMFDAKPSLMPALPDPAGMDPVDQRARSYLHSNCSFCHRPGSSGQGPADLRFATAANMMMVCNVDPQEGDLGIMGAKLMVPGDTTKSILSIRPHLLDVNRMPPLASHVVDAVGTKAIDDWITSLKACP